MSTTFKQHVAPFNVQRLEAISRILGDTEGGLTGTEIGYLLRDSRIPDCSPDMTKWKRLLNAFVTIQNEQQVGNHVTIFIKRATASSILRRTVALYFCTSATLGQSAGSSAGALPGSGSIPNSKSLSNSE